jgi:hypothetical protein
MIVRNRPTAKPQMTHYSKASPKQSRPFFGGADAGAPSPSRAARGVLPPLDLSFKIRGAFGGRALSTGRAFGLRYFGNYLDIDLSLKNK